MNAPRYFFLAMLATVGLSSCDQRRSDTLWDDSDYFSNGEEFSIQISREKRVQVAKFLLETNGYFPQKTYDYWRATWHLRDLEPSDINRPSQIEYLGHCEEKRERDHAEPTFQKGLNLYGFQFTGRNHGILQTREGVLSPKIPALDATDLYGTLKTNKWNDTISACSRQYIFCTHPHPAIYETTYLKLIKKLPVTPNLTSFLTACEKSFGIVESNLTDDLQYLIAVPHNGNETPQGLNHYKAWCYNIHTDQFFEKQFHYGTGDTAVASARSFNGKLFFFVYSEDRKLAIMDDSNQIVAEIPDAKSLFHNLDSKLYWDHANHRVFIWETEIDLYQPERELNLIEYNYQKKTSTTYRLKANPVKVP